MRLIISSITSLIMSVLVFSQDFTAEICTWKNDADGAYNLIHDDYGAPGVDGIWQYADTMAYNRGLVFTIGAITSQCETARNILGYSDPYDYATQVMIPIHGHEIMNHTHTHSCALNQGWGDCSADWTVEDIEYELGVSTKSIDENTGYYPQYHIYPYDQFQDLANEYLKDYLGYIGSRSGWTSNQSGSIPYHRNGYDNYDLSNFYPDEDGFFRTAVIVKAYDKGDGKGNYAHELNDWAEYASTNGVWVNRELHNVGASGWGRVSVNDYRDHLDLLKTKVDNKELWVGTVSEILTYQVQKLNYSVSTVYNGDYAGQVIFTNNSTIDMRNYLDTLSFKSPITVKIDLSDFDDLDSVVVIQKGDTLTHELNGNTLLVDAYPYIGKLNIHNVGGKTITGSEAFRHHNTVLAPNPFDDDGFLLITEDTGLESIDVYNLMGQHIEFAEYTNGMRLGQQLKRGVYLVKVNYSSGTSTIFKVQKQ